MEIWQKMKNYLGLKLEGGPGLELMRHVLNLGFNDLFLDLKTCLLYLGIFPENSKIMKDDLLKRWTAEGFVTGKNGCDPYVIAESFFGELINKNMIQIAEFDDCGHVLSCQVHDIMLEYIILKLREENFITIMNDLHSTKGYWPVRRLLLQVKNPECKHGLETVALTQARSLNFWGPAECIPPLSNFQLLRVLHLDVSEFMAKHFDLSSIGNFFQLKYLRIVGIWYKKLLKELRRLQNLQTLQIVPEAYDDYSLDICELPLTLLHLVVPKHTKLLGDIGKLRFVRSLATLKLDLENINSLGELTNLMELELCLPFPYHNDTAQMDTYYSSLLSSLCKLGICKLESLIIGDFIPRVDVLYQLASLELEVMSLSRDGAEVLARLPVLVHLKLIVVDHVPEEGIIIRRSEFPNLKTFTFSHRVLCLTFEAGGMPRLQSLYIQCDRKTNWSSKMMIYLSASSTWEASWYSR
uniref:Disease resistance protein RPH8A n=2 Tax=Aegilops tauschii TaxID=37682 RepID=M8CTJ6_AEGTA